MLGFPCNQFGGQEPKSEPEILDFVQSNYDIDFPMFAKGDVNGPNTLPLYQLLKEAQPGQGDDADITWNFEKFVIDKNGTVVGRFDPATTPEEISETVERYR